MSDTWPPQSRQLLKESQPTRRYLSLFRRLCPGVEIAPECHNGRSCEVTRYLEYSLFFLLLILSSSSSSSSFASYHPLLYSSLPP